MHIRVFGGGEVKSAYTCVPAKQWEGSLGECLLTKQWGRLLVGSSHQWRLVCWRSPVLRCRLPMKEL